MEKIKKQEVIFIEKESEFYRRTELKNGNIVWEKPSQYGTFSVVLRHYKDDLEKTYSCIAEAGLII